MTEEPIVQMTPNARDKVRRIFEQSDDPSSQAVWVSISGIKGGQFTHELRIAPLTEADDEHVVQHHDDVPVVFPESASEDLRGATITLEGDPTYGAVVVSNPNTPASPQIARSEGADLSGPVAQRVSQVLDAVVNPSIAAHGGRAELARVEGDTAFVRMMGGCQGCGLAKVTLSQGIEVAITDAVEEINRVEDVTDHEAGQDPYFEGAKK